MVEFDELNRSRRVPQPGNSLKFSKTHILQNVMTKNLTIEDQKLEVKSTIPKENNYRGGGMGEAP